MNSGLPQSTITRSIEQYRPKDKQYASVSLIDCNDSFTHNLVQAFLKLGAPVVVLRSHKVEIAQVDQTLGDYLVLSPGPGIPDNAGIAKEVYKKYQGYIPVLGVCLGMQTINEVHGGRTVAAPVPVHGKTTHISHDGRGIFRGISNPTQVARYHSLMIDLPERSEIEIQSRTAEVVMAFRVRSTQTVAVQFHPESFLTPDGLSMLRNFLELMS